MTPKERYDKNLEKTYEDLIDSLLSPFEQKLIALGVIPMPGPIKARLTSEKANFDSEKTKTINDMADLDRELTAIHQRLYGGS